MKQKSQLGREEPENCTKQPRNSQTRSTDKSWQSRTRMEGQRRSTGKMGEHFEEVLVREARTNSIEEHEVETDEIGEMDTTKIRDAEV